VNRYRYTLDVAHLVDGWRFRYRMTRLSVAQCAEILADVQARPGRVYWLRERHREGDQDWHYAQRTSVPVPGSPHPDAKESAPLVALDG
jgi:hypothetical protein